MARPHTGVEVDATECGQEVLQLQNVYGDKMTATFCRCRLRRQCRLYEETLRVL